MCSVLVLSLTLAACNSNYDPDELADDETLSISYMILLDWLRREQKCQEPNAVDVGAAFTPPTRYCIINKMDTGLIYNATTSSALTTESAYSGIQLECRGVGGIIKDNNGWYKSDKFPMLPGAPVSRIGKQDVNRDGLGSIISYKPFATYKAGDTLLCVTADSNKDQYYQIIRIQ